MHIKTFAKAVVAGVTSGLGALITATADGANSISVNEALIALSAALAAFTATYFIPNTPQGG